MNEIGRQAVKAAQTDFKRRPSCSSCGDILVEDWSHIWYCRNCVAPDIEVGCYVKDEAFNAMVEEEH